MNRTFVIYRAIIKTAAGTVLFDRGHTSPAALFKQVSSFRTNAVKYGAVLMDTEYTKETTKTSMTDEQWLSGATCEPSQVEFVDIHDEIASRARG